jgi:uncharacterized protein (TIGR02118 family)
MCVNVKTTPSGNSIPAGSEKGQLTTNFDKRASTMVTRISLLYRKEGMSLDAFRKHWREVHAPIASRMPGLRHYVQQDVTAVLGLLGGATSTAQPDGIAEVSFDNDEASKASLASAEGREAVNDLSNFCRAISTFVVNVRQIV